MTTRDLLIDRFLANTAWSGASRGPLAGDASNRRYERLCQKDGQSAVLMDAPPEKGEDVRPFVRVAQHLRALGLSAPEIFAADEALGLLLIEDLGDDLFARVVGARPKLELELYRAATDVLISLQSAPVPNLKLYDTEIMTEMADLSFIWYQRGALGQTDVTAQMIFNETFANVLSRYVPKPSVLIQRDYHAENLLWLPDRHGVSRVGLLDFQDAMLGDPAYDLVSLLQDARRDVPLALEAQIISYYLDQTGQDPEEFLCRYAVLGAQRNLRILGVFTRLCLLSGKAHYVDLIPRVWRYLARDLDHPALKEIAPHIRANLPAPTPEILQRLKDQCA